MIICLPEMAPPDVKLNIHTPLRQSSKELPCLPCPAVDPQMCIHPLAKTFPNATKAEVQAVQDRLHADLQVALLNVLGLVRKLQFQLTFMQRDVRWEGPCASKQTLSSGASLGRSG